MNRTSTGSGQTTPRSAGQPPTARRGTSRRGVTLVECLVTAVLLGSAASLSLQFLVSIGRQQQQLQQRELALLTAGNLLEQLTARPDRLPEAGQVEGLTLPPDVLELLPDARVKVTVTGRRLPGPIPAPQAGAADSEPPEADNTPEAGGTTDEAAVLLRRLVLELGWTADNGQPARPVRLLTWINPGAAPPEDAAPREEER